MFGKIASRLYLKITFFVTKKSILIRTLFETRKTLILSVAHKKVKKSRHISKMFSFQRTSTRLFSLNLITKQQKTDFFLISDRYPIPAYSFNA